ncbi:MAG: fimbria/pilus periplasmic chaperone [Cyanobacteria bacterium P01_A01_bin.84]
MFISQKNTSQQIRSIVLGLIAAFTLGIPMRVTALEIGVSPPRFEIEINDKQRSQSFKIKNFAKEPVEMRAYVHSWVLDEHNKVKIVESTEQTLDQWITFTPSKFTIPAGGEQTVRFAIRPKVKPNSGEHRAILYLEEVPKKTNNSQSVVTLARLGVVIYAYSGKVERVGTLNSVNVDAKANGTMAAVFDVSSEGNAHVRVKGQYAIWKADQYPGAETTQKIQNLGKPKAQLPANIVNAGIIKINPILPSTRRQLEFPIAKKLPPGKYILDINGELSGVPIDKGIPFTVPAVSNNPSKQKQPLTSLSK